MCLTLEQDISGAKSGKPIFVLIASMLPYDPYLQGGGQNPLSGKIRLRLIYIAVSTFTFVCPSIVVAALRQQHPVLKIW